jgi:hypothetical protein
MKPLHDPAGYRTCPRCGSKNNGYTQATGDERAPEPGDVSLCWECGGMNIFTDDGKVRLPTEEERNHLLAQPDVLEAMELRAVYRTMYGDR